jgi:hypothetical protein
MPPFAAVVPPISWVFVVCATYVLNGPPPAAPVGHSSCSAARSNATANASARLSLIVLM